MLQQELASGKAVATQHSRKEEKMTKKKEKKRNRTIHKTKSQQTPSSHTTEELLTAPDILFSTVRSPAPLPLIRVLHPSYPGVSDCTM
jgi:hypothetical protein